MIQKEKLEATVSLEDAIFEIYGLKLEGRSSLFEQEEMKGEVAEEYFQLGVKSRTRTYQNIVEDFKNRTGCYACNHPHYQVGTILDVGCGPGILSVELAEKTGAKIIGIDLSKDMLSLARKYLEERTNEKRQKILEFQQRYPVNSNNKNPLFQVDFLEGSVYHLSRLIEPVNYIVCRNALHRFKNPKRAIREMYKTLLPRGKIYLRDLRRDADWGTIVERINGRWNNPELVEDYLKAMAGMLKIDEVKDILEDLNIKRYNIEEGNLLVNEESSGGSIKEFSSEVEWVGVIEKSSTKDNI